MVVPGGSEPDCFISQVHSALTVLPGVNCGKALATTVPQVNSSVPYSSTTDVIGDVTFNRRTKGDAIWEVERGLVKCYLGLRGSGYRLRAGKCQCSDYQAQRQDQMRWFHFNRISVFGSNGVSVS